MCSKFGGWPYPPTFSTLLLERRDNGILLVTLNRPEAANAMNTQLGLDLMALFEGFSVDLEGLRVVILTGQGKAFCAGGDLKQRNGMTDEAWQAQHLVFERMLRAIIACPLPVIAAVNGAAYGGGCEIAAAYRFRLRRDRGALCAHRSDARHHARRRRHAESARVQLASGGRKS